jgi:peptide/nickel transport system permease protein
MTDHARRDPATNQDIGPVTGSIAAPAPRSQARTIVRRFLRHRLAVTSLAIFVAVVLFAYVGGWLWRYSYTDITPDSSQPPSFAHPFGTDAIGHDELAMVMQGTQKSIAIAFVVALVAGAIGTIWGATAGYFHGRVDNLMMRFTDLVLTLPLLVVAAVLATNTHGSWFYVSLIIGGLQWAYVARIVRGEVLSLRERDFVEAARALGARARWIIARHLIPNVLGTVIVTVTILVAVAILLEAALSFLGFGVQPPDTSLGLLVSNAQSAVSVRPWLFYFPGLFIIIIALTVNFIGDGLRDAFDPKQTRRR